ncbi:uncharacterized protein BDW70DRAFT_76475 [Aspergillus foveolatus]|uniref:uncharacterized protein n=1 Tax=Aspergillus foveolatus TaxID=210207 RepID=UPI003CCDFA64
MATLLRHVDTIKTGLPFGRWCTVSYCGRPKILRPASICRKSFPSGLILFGLLTLLPCIGPLHSRLAEARRHNSESEL